MSDRFLFFTAPYVGAFVFPAACILRYLLCRQQGLDLRAEWIKARRLFQCGVCWRGGLLVLLLAHLAGLLFPREVLLWNRAVPRLLLLEGVGYAFGALTLLGLAGLLRRELFDPERRAESTVMDCALLAALLVPVISGLGMAALYRWASSWSAVTLTPYVVSMLHLRPRLELVAGMPYLVKLHVFSAAACVAVLPWTRLAHLVVYPAHRGFDILLWPLRRLAGTLWPGMEQWGLRTAKAIWREEDE